MNADQRENLFRSELAFSDTSSTSEQQHIRGLHAAIEGDPDRDKLIATMNRYCKWFDEQPPLWRWSLQQKSAKDRVAEIKRQLNKEKTIGNEIRLDAKNRQEVARWMDSYVTQHEHEPPFVEAVLTEWVRGGRGPASQRGAMIRDGDAQTGRFAKLPPDEKHRVLREMVLHGWQSGKPLVNPTDAELASLRASLSTDVRDRLEKLKPGDQTRTIGGWLRQTASSEREGRLADFFEKTLSDEERDHLMGLPGDEIDRELGHMYMAYLLRNDPHRGDWQRPGRQRPNAPHGSGGPRRMGTPSDREPTSVNGGMSKGS